MIFEVIFNKLPIYFGRYFQIILPTNLLIMILCMHILYSRLKNFKHIPTVTYNL